MENRTRLLMSEESLLKRMESCSFGLSLAGVISESSINGFKRTAELALHNLKALYPNKLIPYYQKNKGHHSPLFLGCLGMEPSILYKGLN